MTVSARKVFGLVLSSPTRQAWETCQLARLAASALIDSDVVDGNYGYFEGLTSEQIHKIAPGWLTFRDRCLRRSGARPSGTRV